MHQSIITIYNEKACENKYFVGEDYGPYGSSLPHKPP